MVHECVVTELRLSHDSHMIAMCLSSLPFHFSDSRILIGSLSRHNLIAMQDDHMKGVHKHAQQIRDQSQVYVKHTLLAYKLISYVPKCLAFLQH